MDLFVNSPPPPLLRIVNQVFEMEKKILRSDDPSLIRHIGRIKAAFEELGLVYDNPEGESYNETRTDCEASISGSLTENLVITEAIKPIIRLNVNGFSQIVQRGVVVVESSGL
ncbi:MAG: hypothetical protein SF052_16820 [Bacteroidia bacterium]|nr:hypothetical protein [Bacteroidia bacterium]